jgi:hypothetical protein
MRGHAPTPVSAVEVLRSMTGDCKNMATLYVAFARSIGIPSRTVGGMILVDSVFYGHMWAESYVGKWVPIDPTLHQDFVDAAHIPTQTVDDLRILDSGAQGEITECAYLSSLTGDPPIPDNCTRTICPHGIAFDIPHSLSMSITQCSVHASIPPEWTKMIWSDGRVFLYPTRVRRVE